MSFVGPKKPTVKVWPHAVTKVPVPKSPKK
jgi:hypothetical protein